MWINRTSSPREMAISWADTTAHLKGISKCENRKSISFQVSLNISLAWLLTTLFCLFYQWAPSLGMGSGGWAPTVALLHIITFVPFYKAHTSTASQLARLLTRLSFTRQWPEPSVRCEPKLSPLNLPCVFYWLFSARSPRENNVCFVTVQRQQLAMYTFEHWPMWADFPKCEHAKNALFRYYTAVLSVM